MFLTQSHMPSSLLPRVRLVLRGSESCSGEHSCRRGSPRERVRVPRPSGSPRGGSASQMPGSLAGRAQHDYYYYFLIWKEHKPRCFPRGSASVSAEVLGFRISVSGPCGGLPSAPPRGGHLRPVSRLLHRAGSPTCSAEKASQKCSGCFSIRNSISLFCW